MSKPIPVPVCIGTERDFDLRRLSGHNFTICIVKSIHKFMVYDKT